MFIPIEFQKLKELTNKDTIKIKAEYQESCGLKSSKFAGNPYFPINEEYPVDTNGNKMFLLAQVNFTDIPNHHELPNTGILQFYISANHESYGLDFENPKSQKNFSIRFWENIEEESQDIDLNTELNINEDSLVPIYGEHRLTFITANDSASINSIEAAVVLGSNPFEILEDISLDDKEEEIFYNSIKNSVDNTGHKLLGNSSIINQDPRIDNKYQLLLQIDTDMNDDNDIMWGDNGVAQFFITSNDLQSKNFNSVWFHWDSKDT